MNTLSLFTLKFKIRATKKLLAITKAKAKIQLVMDEGIYLMTFKPDRKQGCIREHKVVYAEGLSPNDPSWYSKKVSLFGGDDTCDGIPVKTLIQASEVKGAKYLCIHVKEKNLTAFAA